MKLAVIESISEIRPNVDPTYERYYVTNGFMCLAHTHLFRKYELCVFVLGGTLVPMNMMWKCRGFKEHGGKFYIPRNSIFKLRDFPIITEPAYGLDVTDLLTAGHITQFNMVK